MVHVVVHGQHTHIVFIKLEGTHGSCSNQSQPPGMQFLVQLFSCTGSSLAADQCKFPRKWKQVQLALEAEIAIRAFLVKKKDMVLLEMCV